ncbi:MAG: hypothetical protein PSU93_10925 [Methylobacter sp.]|uniref:Integrase n=1 Tax=Candidatus Methylobacter titanis TaxID=3053457 RepID=A0AA43TLZ0_9GAMM|nr:hypothetical protein [Candidatus Methylobacter titanis]
MGRKSRTPAKLNPQSSNEITPSSEESDLPQLKQFIDIENGRSGKDLEITRFYLSTPTKEEAIAAKCLGRILIGGNAGRTGFKSVAIGDYAREKVSELFGQGLSRLLIHLLDKKNMSKNSVNNLASSFRHFINFLSDIYVNNLDNFSIYSIKYDDWEKYREYIENSILKDKRNTFKIPHSIFSDFSPTSFNGSINRITSKSINKRTSSFLEGNGAYSDAVMYQLLALFIFRFERQVEYMEHYESLCNETMGGDWLRPGQNAICLNDPKNKKLTDQFVLIDKLLSDINGYKRILDHKLIWFKLGNRRNKSFIAKIFSFIHGSESLKDKYTSYKLWEKNEHFPYSLDLNDGKLGANDNIFGLYVKRSVSEDKTGSMNQMAFYLANIVMIYTGLNKEVVLSWPSLVNGKSILDQNDSLFIRDDGHGREIEISGIKARTGAKTKDKPIRIAIVIGSPLFNMLKEYEKHAKTNSNGPFFEFNSKSFTKTWGGRTDTFKKYSIIDDNGELLSTLNTTKFRKVFASTKMLEHLSGIKNKQDLADLLRRDLDHKNFDVTLSHYILRSQHATSVLDLAIVAITSEKIRQALEFKGVIEINQEPKTENLVYLCECADPLNPTHGFAIAKKCTYYDLCLGCKQSIVFEMHLPYICYRILQYETRRIEMGNEWSAIFEDKWMIAHDALNKYKNQDKENGERLIKNAWQTARSNETLLPPIIMTKF